MISVGIPDTLGEFQGAQRRLRGKVHLTPLLQCQSIQDLLPANSRSTTTTAATNKNSHAAAQSSCGLLYQNLWFKCENFQRTGSFKIRGATNAVQLSLERERSKGRYENKKDKFITFSSGNHAQALALAAKEAGAEAHVVIPKNAPEVKAKAVEGYGATLHWCEPVIEDRARTAAKVNAVIGPLRLIHPTDNRDVIAGQGTILLEIAAQLAEQCDGATPDAIIVPVGGGGLIGGIGIAAKLLNPNIKIFGAEPFGADDATRSFTQGKVQGHRAGHPATIADGLLTTLSDRTLAAMQFGVDKMFTATEGEMKEAFRLVFERMKIVIEPSAAVGVAVALKGHPELQRCKNVVVVICGGNVQLEKMGDYISKL